MQITKLTPNIVVEDVRTGVDWYVDALGAELMVAVAEGSEEPVFSLEGVDGPLAFAMLQLDEVELMLNSVTAVEKDLPGYRPGGSDTVTLYLDVDDVDAVYERLRGRATVVKAPFDTFYGAREVIFRDPAGLVLGFAERPGHD